MSDYTYGDYVYFKNTTDKKNEHNNNFTLNQITDFHITSPFKLCNDTFEPFPKLFFNKMIKMDEIICPNCGSFFTSQCMEQKKRKNGKTI